MRAIAVISLVPVLGDVNSRKLQRRLERNKPERLGDDISQVLRQCHDTFGLRRHDGAGDEARHAQHDIRGRYLGGEHALCLDMRGMAGLGRHGQDVTLAEEAGT